MLTFDEFHPTIHARARTAEGFLCSSANTSVITVTLATMLMFRFEGQKAAKRKEMMLAWMPLVLLDWAILEFLIGLVLWYTSNNSHGRSILIGMQVVVLLGFVIGVAISMYISMSVPGGLGNAESTAAHSRQSRHTHTDTVHSDTASQSN